MASTQLTPAERMSCTLLSELFLDVRVTPHDHYLVPMLQDKQAKEEEKQKERR
jgi:hypothetical protein